MNFVLNPMQKIYKEVFWLTVWKTFIICSHFRHKICWLHIGCNGCKLAAFISLNFTSSYHTHSPHNPLKHKRQTEYYFYLALCFADWTGQFVNQITKHNAIIYSNLHVMYSKISTLAANWLHQIYCKIQRFTDISKWFIDIFWTKFLHISRLFF